ncbi:MAG: PHP-associated domain-containing protein, partial [Candidatus Aenigmatarchaeota archaeon]
NVEGNREVREYAKQQGILLIRGIEITTLGGDISALGVDEVITGTYDEIIDRVHQLGGIAILNHPFAGLLPDPIQDKPDILKKFDAIEVYNAGTPLAENVEAIELAKKIKKPGIGASDAHSVDAIGNAFIAVAANDEKGVLEEIKKGRVTIGIV